MTTETTAHALAGEAYGYFETAKRPDGQEYTRTNDDAPEWLTSLIREAHGDMLPDDWRYETIREALGSISDAGDSADLDDLAPEFADGVDVYTGELLAWAGSHLSRMAYCDEAVAEGLAEPDADIARRLALGQYMERREVFDSVRRSLEELAEEEFCPLCGDEPHGRETDRECPGTAE